MEKVRTVVVWVLAVLLGVMFLLGALPKILGNAAMVARFEDWGYPAWFLRVVGVAEALGGLLLIVPRTSTWSACVLVVVMMGAVYTHVSTGIGSPVTAMLFGIVAATVGWLRRDRALLLGSPRER